MERTHYITVTEFCHHYDIDIAFINQLQQCGLIEVVEETEEGLIPLEQLGELEKYTRLHADLDINPEGIEAIEYLLQRMRQMQSQIADLKARLRLYEGE
ncbi:MAG: chaperone modulator CbpM [Chitinophagaceae bacterium]